nr:2Fe-2S iron-sulfur cluster-binding protein [uncultured Undibacterium sp.]
MSDDSSPSLQYRIRFEQHDIEFQCAANETVLHAALKGGVVIANSCRNGTCRTCLCHLRSGQVDYLVAWPGLSFDEKADGYILPCVATPLSELIIDKLVLSSA